MKTSLQLKMGQQLAMTPQLQQAIRLLQLSTLDLQQEIQQVLESNPMLELEQEYEDDFSDSQYPETDLSTLELQHDNAELDEQWSKQELPEDLPVDSQWEDTYQSNAGISSNNTNQFDCDFDSDPRHATTENLQDHLLWQLNLTPMSELDRSIAMMFIDGVDDDGYLHTSVDDILESLKSSEADRDEVLAVLHRLQQFDPAGVFGYDLRDCLLIQLNQYPKDTPWLQETKDVISKHIDLLGSRDYASLMRRARLKEHELQEVLRLVQALNPKPGSSISQGHSEYIIPDIIVRNVRDEWRVELNPDISPQLRVNEDYVALIKRNDNSQDNTFLRDNLQEARWFIKSLQSRNDTLLKVASKIVEYQLDFFEEGEEAMKPLVLSDIATAVDMHESTISRVTTQKFMHTPRGVFELKYFFSSHLNTDQGGECSSTAIRAMIKSLIAEENSRKPLSDNKIATMLADNGIQVARRTIAKYREAMNIPPSNERKQLI